MRLDVGTPFWNGYTPEVLYVHIAGKNCQKSATKDGSKTNIHFAARVEKDFLQQRERCLIL